MSEVASAPRPWQRIEQQLREQTSRDREQRMRHFVNACWPTLAPSGVSWLGFYQRDPGNSQQLLLAAREPLPACSPIGLHGACGKSLLSAAPVVVMDVLELGNDYIACDPRDRSEVVVPCLDVDGFAWGVLDLDSHQLANFTSDDATALAGLLRVAGLSV